MAESITKNIDKDSANNLECAVCLQICIHPAQLPCGHIFCFLCVKGIANQSKRCAMCRQEIPREFMDNPKLLENTVEIKESLENVDGGYQWFYEGRNGWWQYDERTSKELEASYKTEERTCELLIAGFLYIADFDSMVQRRRNDPSKRRRIKRDLCTIPKKGIAGIKLSIDDRPPIEQPESLVNIDQCTTRSVTLAPIEVESQEDLLQSTIDQMQALNLTTQRENRDSESEQEVPTSMHQLSNT